MKTQLQSPTAPARSARSSHALAHILARRACLWPALVALAALAFGSSQAQAAVTEAWVHRYNNGVNNANDQAIKVVRDAAGDLIVTGNTYNGIQESDILTIKYSGADGVVLWHQRYDGPASGDDRATALAVDGGGNVVVTGASSNGSPHDDGDYHTAKYAAADGALLWEKRYNGPANSGDDPSAVAVDVSGNVLVTGCSYNGASNGDYYTAKYAAADGALLWEHRYDGPANSDDIANAVAVDGSGNVVVTGASYNGSNTDSYTAKVCFGGRRAPLGETLQRPGELLRQRTGVGGGRQRQRGGHGSFLQR